MALFCLSVGGTWRVKVVLCLTPTNLSLQNILLASEASLFLKTKSTFFERKKGMRQTLFRVSFLSFFFMVWHLLSPFIHLIVQSTYIWAYITCSFCAKLCGQSSDCGIWGPAFMELSLLETWLLYLTLLQSLLSPFVLAASQGAVPGHWLLELIGPPSS